MARVVAISGGDLNSTKTLNKYSIKLSGKSKAYIMKYQNEELSKKEVAFEAME